ncbi:MAG: class I SAM-dependent methyltransferase, partial [Bacteroidota bacterium]
RFCNSSRLESIVDLGMSPLSQNFLSVDKLNEAEVFYPLHTFVCTDCWLVQLDAYVSGREIFEGEYLYLSSYSSSCLEHARRHTHQIVDRLALGKESQVVEIASNDGYLLQYFLEKGIPVVGVEPSENCSGIAREKGIPTETMYFGVDSARLLRVQYGPSDLLIGNNVLAHVPDINDFVAGLKIMLGEKGVISMEFPHLQRLVEENQFDTIYHEHFSYLSLLSVSQIFETHGLVIFDVEELNTHGGSLRIYARHMQNENLGFTDAYLKLMEREIELGMNSREFYTNFGEKVRETKRKLLRFLIDAHEAGKQVVAYGAPAKGNTLLNYCGIREDLLEFAVDLSDFKQGKFMPGTHIPIYHPDKIAETKPDYILILPWNLKKEIVSQLSYARDWGAEFVVPIPEPRVLKAEELIDGLEILG